MSGLPFPFPFPQQTAQSFIGLYPPQAPDPSQASHGPSYGHSYWREGPPPMNFLQCKTYLAAGLQNGGLRQVDALAHILGIGPRSTWFANDIESFLYYNDSKHAQILSIDAEWYESNHRKITELGIGSLSVYTVRAARTKNFIDCLDSMKVHHMRILENAHMVNGRRCAGHPEDFQFGRTGFVPQSQAKSVLHKHLMKYNYAYMQPLYLQPIVIVGHAIGNDVDEFKKYLGIDFEQYPVLITLDTQVMARELGIKGSKCPNISLQDLLLHYGIEKDTYLHNAGNDAGLTMIAACLLANDRYTNKLDTSQSQKDFEQLKLQIRGNDYRVYGCQRHCTRCNCATHMISDCKKKLFCPRCAELQPENAETHSMNKCLIVSTPCERCSASPKPKLHQHADTHLTEDCLFN